MATLTDLQSEYDARRNRAEAQAETRRRALFARWPVLQELEERRTRVLVLKLGEVLRAPARKEELLAAAAEEVARLDEQLLRFAGEHEIDLNALRVQYSCPRCRDTGYLTGADGRRTPCPCLKARIYREIYGAEDLDALPGSDAAYDASLFPEEKDARQMAGIRTYVRRYADAYPQNAKKNLVFIGGAGLGKSFMLAALAKLLREKEEDVVYLRAGRLFSLFHADRLGEGARLEPLFAARVLLIDDLGTEPMTQNVTVEYFFRLLEERLSRDLPLLIATNLSELQLKARYTERVSSRLLAAATSDVIHFSGRDLRLAGK